MGSREVPVGDDGVRVADEPEPGQRRRLPCPPGLAQGEVVEVKLARFEHHPALHAASRAGDREPEIHLHLPVSPEREHEHPIARGRPHP
jgi:hypothetical protein